jgi:hypothetical protein
MNEAFFTCPACERVSHIIGDIANRYCGACNLYADDIEVHAFPCAGCGVAVDTLWLNRGRGMISRRGVTLVADSVFHTACWDKVEKAEP